MVVGRSARTGEELWRRADIHPARVLATEPGRVHLLTDRRELVTVDPLTGTTRSSFVLDLGRDGIGWKPGRAYAVDGYVAVERLRLDPRIAWVGVMAVVTILNFTVLQAWVFAVPARGRRS